jgi:hypothetical protein
MWFHRGHACTHIRTCASCINMRARAHTQITQNITFKTQDTEFAVIIPYTLIIEKSTNNSCRVPN